MEQSRDIVVEKRKSRALNISVIGLLAGVYSVATIALGTLSYGPLNLRLTNILLGVVPIVGWPAVLGLTLGVLLSNVASTIGPIDYLSAGFSFLGLVAIHLLRKRSVLAGLTIYSLILSIWVTFELHAVFGLPFSPTFYGVLLGISIVSIILAYFLYRALRASHLLRRFEELNA